MSIGASFQALQSRFSSNPRTFPLSRHSPFPFGCWYVLVCRQVRHWIISNTASQASLPAHPTPSFGTHSTKLSARGFRLHLLGGSLRIVGFLSNVGLFFLVFFQKEGDDIHLVLMRHTIHNLSFLLFQCV